MKQWWALGLLPLVVGLLVILIMPGEAIVLPGTVLVMGVAVVCALLLLSALFVRNQTTREAQAATSLDAQLAAVRQDLYQARDGATQARAELDVTQRELAALRATQSEEQVKHEGVAAQIATVSARLDETSAALKAAQAQERAAQQERVLAQSQLSEEQARAREAHEQVSSLQATLQTLTAQLTESQQQVATVQAELTESQAHQIQQNDQLQLVTTQLHEVQAQLHEAAAQNEALRTEHEALRAQFDALHTQFDAMHSDYSALQATFSAQVATAREAVEAEAINDRHVFYGRLDHEIKNSLGVMRAATTNLLEGASEHIRRDAQMSLIEQIDQTSDLVEQLHRLVKIRAGTSELDLDTLDVPTLLEDVIHNVRTYKKASRLTTRTEIRDVPTPLPPIKGDHDLLFLVLRNLLHNAIKYTPDGGRVKVYAEYKDNLDCVVIEVADTGRGILPMDLPLIYKELHIGSNAGSEAGYGIGLALVRAILDRHSATITIKSDVGRGTVATIQLPANAQSALFAVPTLAPAQATG